MSLPYSVPEQHRDFILLIGLSLVPILATVGYAQFGPIFGPKRAAICVEGMCCDVTAKPAVQGLTDVSGILGITPDYQGRVIHLELRTTRPTSPRAIWDAVENTSLRPIRLDITNRTFNSRPVK